MNTSESFKALRRANPRAQAGFPAALEAAADALRERLVTSAADVPWTFAVGTVSRGSPQRARRSRSWRSWRH
jgi:hypothetical protein